MPPRTRSFVAVAVVPLLFTAAACSPDEHSTKAPPTGSSPTSGAAAGTPGGDRLPVPPGGASAQGTVTLRPLTGADLTTALLGNDDLPSDWQTAGDGGINPDIGRAADPRCQPVLDMMGDQKAAIAPAGAAAVRLMPRKYGVSTGHAVVLRSYADDGATRLFNAFTAAVRACSEFSATDSMGATTDYRRGVSSAPTMGDESFKIITSATFSGVTFANQYTVVRSGNVIVMFTAPAQDSTMTDSGPYEYPETIMKAQVDKVIAAQKP